MKKILISIFVFVLVLCIGLPVNAVSALDSIETQAKDKIVYETSHGVVASSTILSKEKSALESDSGFYIKICFDYSYPEENVPLLRKDATAEEADAALVRHRENVRKFYAEKNNELIKNYNLSGDIFISQYTSFVIIHEESYESNLNLLNQMTKDKNIQRIYITEDDIYENQIAESTEVPAWVYAPPISLADAYKTFCFSDSLFSTNGTEVKVGVVEAAGL